MILSKEKQETLDNIIIDLRQTANVVAIVLGGSHAVGAATDKSDLDIGIYYYDEKPFSIDAIKSMAKKYAMNNGFTVTGFYEWGPWVNGGAWIETASGQIDFLYRNIGQVKSTIEKSKKGEWENHFEQQPPYGFSSVIYLGETKTCIPLYDPTGIVKKLKSEIETYPPKLKETIIQQSLWSAEFTIWHADYFSKKQDIYNTIGCLARAVKNIVNTLFAINELYPIGDKRAIEVLEKADNKPINVKEKIEHILCANKYAINHNIDLLKQLFSETIELAGGTYKSIYKLKNIES